MRYFFIEVDKQVVNAPYIVNWMEKFESRHLRWGSYDKIAPKTVLWLKNNKNTVFTDIVSMPFFLISKKMKDVLSIYEPNMRYKEMILIDIQNELMNQYFLPQLEEYDCLAEDSKFNQDHSIIIKGVIDEDKVGDKCLFTVANVKNRYIVARLDFLESMLRRDAIIKFTEINVKRS